ncbi:fluoride efflux transporter FluC [Planobispora takensis]|uniref:Fluoride-specific ion channel FluC n=1 Tax=Planobispora takensis TaxID=1367882 RepID=A0A8J3T8K4_9ACTN|nr:CrcB family protein [Planobispora takensis]GII06093.1 putative fluoride ion transporter CrcB 2 [Planobispora takensis]
MSALLVALGAAVGAPLRYLTDRAVQSRRGAAFPWGTLTVNVIGSALLGALLALPVPGWAMTLAGTGLCGALSTYSTFAYETVRLAGSGARLRAVLNVVVSVVGGLAAAGFGVVVARALS